MASRRKAPSLDAEDFAELDAEDDEDSMDDEVAEEGSEDSEEVEIHNNKHSPQKPTPAASNVEAGQASYQKLYRL